MNRLNNAVKRYGIGYIQGAYDVFHVKNLDLLNYVKEQCDYLVVGVYSNSLVSQLEKNPPSMDENERYKMIWNIKAVNKVIIVDTVDIMKILRNVRFNVMFVEDEWKKYVCRENVQNEFLQQNIDVVYLSNLQNTSICDVPSNSFKIGYTTGTFDMFHVGHLHILQKAKAMCDYLIVGVSTDELVQSYKNKQPIIPFSERISIIESTKFADLVIAQENRDKIAAFERLNFDVMFVGDDWKGNTLFEEVEKYLNAHGAEVVYFPYTQGVSSTMLRKKMSGK